MLILTLLMTLPRMKNYMDDSSVPRITIMDTVIMDEEAMVEVMVMDQDMAGVTTVATVQEGQWEQLYL